MPQPQPRPSLTRARIGTRATHHTPEIHTLSWHTTLRTAQLSQHRVGETCRRSAGKRASTPRDLARETGPEGVGATRAARAAQRLWPAAVTGIATIMIMIVTLKVMIIIIAIVIIIIIAILIVVILIVVILLVVILIVVIAVSIVIIIETVGQSGKRAGCSAPTYS